LRFALACPLLSTIVVGFGETWHLDEALGAAKMSPLPASAIQALERMWHSDPAFRRMPA
jgi:aryl-alcohol dehydrogenase-like predicted oxidoreductase